MLSKAIISEIQEKCDAFVDQMIRISDISPYKRIRRQHPGFEILETANKEFYEYAYYERYMESAIRDNLINPIMEILFKNSTVKYEQVDREARCINFRNEDIEERYPFEFCLLENGTKIGVRYTGVCEDSIFEGMCSDYGIDKVIIIRWEQRYRKSNYSDGVDELSVNEFLEEFFDKDVADFVIQTLKKTIKMANDSLGFQTIPMLSLRNLATFKEEKMVDFAEIDYGKLCYSVVEKGRIINWNEFTIPNEDIEVMKEYFISNELYKVFDGKKQFSRCFMTAEYLFNIFKAGNSFDYTAVVSGYLKAVEQLAYEIVLAELKLRPSKDILMKRKTSKFNDYKYVESISVKKPETNAWHVPFLPKNEKYFDITLKPLLWLLHDYASIWRISEKGREIVHSALLKYGQECRNDHFHKDNINDFTVVESIRNNTILIFYLLISGCKLSNDIDMTRTILGIEEDEFSDICRVLYKMPYSCDRYIFKYGEREIKVLKLMNQAKPVYDDNGTLMDTIIEFVQVDDYRIEDYDEFFKNLPSERRIHFSKENIPDEIWLVLRTGEKMQIK